MTTPHGPPTGDAPAPRPPAGVWAVVPAYNEGDRLAATLAGLLPVVAEVVVVDDGSTDRTHELAAASGAWVLRHGVNCGQGAALQTGFDFALQRGAEVVVTFDADGQHAADEVPRLVEPILSGECDVVLGSRTLGGAVRMPAARRVLLAAGTVFTRLVAGIRVTDTHNGFRAFSRRALQEIRIRENRMAHASELLHQVQRRGLRYCERPVTVRYNAEVLAKGQSNWSAIGIAARYLLGSLMK